MFVYYEYGNQIKTGEEDFLNEATYTGAVYDEEIGLYYMNARYYDCTTGQFISRDTYLGNAYNPWTQNLYTYTGNNPINYTDPTGHFALTLAATAKAAFAGGLVGAISGGVNAFFSGEDVLTGILLGGVTGAINAVAVSWSQTASIIVGSISSLVTYIGGNVLSGDRITFWGVIGSAVKGGYYNWATFSMLKRFGLLTTYDTYMHQNWSQFASETLIGDVVGSYLSSISIGGEDLFLDILTPDNTPSVEKRREEFGEPFYENFKPDPDDKFPYSGPVPHA